jgi:hypothetical protein
LSERLLVKRIAAEIVCIGGAAVSADLVWLLFLSGRLVLVYIGFSRRIRDFF